MEILQRLGEQIFNYFLRITSPNESFILHIDEYTYKSCAKTAGLSEQDITLLLHGKGIYSFSSNNSFESLAIVALEIKIFYDIETDVSLINSYNTRLEKNIASFNSQQEIQSWYNLYQDRIWNQVRQLFKNYNRFIEIPEKHFGAYRYVQYPKSQRLVSQREIILYADEFKKHLRPHEIISFTEFGQRVSFKFVHKNNEHIKRMIFAFYNIWDGQASLEILENKVAVSRNAETFTRNDINIKFADEEISVFINNKRIDLKSDKIKSEWLYKLDNRTHLLTKKGLAFMHDEIFDDWVPYSSSLELHEEVLFLTEQKTVPFYLQEYVDRGEIRIRKYEKYMFWIVSSNNSKVYEMCRISLTEKTCIELIGGIKSKRNTYYTFAMPAIKLNQIIDSKNKPYTSIFIDTKEYSLSNNMLHLPSDFPIGTHYAKLWDSTDLKFSIELAMVSNTASSIHGWNFNYEHNKVCPADSIENVVIDGFILKQQLPRHTEFTVDDFTNKKLRPFLSMNKFLANRFSDFERRFDIIN